jgi:hypothetical protein
MFIKVTTSGGRRYAQLVESFRNEAGQPRQRTLATLGRLELGGDVDRLIAALSRAQGRADAPVSSARITDLRFLEARAAGDVWALWQLWRALDLEGLSLAWRRSKTELDVLSCLRTMVFNLHRELFQFTVDEQRLQYLEGLDGKLLLVTNTDTPAAEVVQRYKSLADIERGFRALKSEIEIGPVYHRLPRRIRAHALVCFLSLILHRVLRMRLKASNRQESPARLLDQLRRIQHQTAQTPDGQLLRGLTELGAAQRELFAAVRLPVPTPDGLMPSAAGGTPTVDL